MPSDLEGLVVGVIEDREDKDLAPVAHDVAISTRKGTVDVPVALHPAWSYEVHISVGGARRGAAATDPQLTSPASSGELAPAE